MLLKDNLVGTLEPARATVGLLHILIVGEATFGVEDLQAFGFAHSTAHCIVARYDGHVPQDNRMSLVLCVGLDVLSHQSIARGGVGALLAFPAVADVLLELLFAGATKSTELALMLLLLRLLSLRLRVALLSFEGCYSLAPTCFTRLDVMLDDGLQRVRKSIFNSSRLPRKICFEISSKIYWNKIIPDRGCRSHMRRT